MTDRLSTIYSALVPCRCLADVGCDHGYIARKAIDDGLCERVIISDISAPSLKKAERLLAGFSDRVTSAVCDGLCELHKNSDQILIAGMGGEEIISILNGAPFRPQRLVLQPMKNVDKLRKRLLNGGYAILSDRMFKAEGKFYSLLVAEPGEDSYNEEELLLGRDNLIERGADFLEFVCLEKQRYTRLLDGEMPEAAREKIIKMLKTLGGLNNENY